MNILKKILLSIFYIDSIDNNHHYAIAMLRQLWTYRTLKQEDGVNPQ